MQATDFRIGNWVKSKLHGGLETEVFSVFHDAFHLGANPFALYKFHEIEPIPLTEEWLLKFGFEESGHLIFISIGNGYSLCYNTHSGICFISAPTSLNYLPPLKYIHQLQNLYHALTGNELKIK